LRNQAGETVAQKDGPAGSGHYPTSLWDPGQIVADELSISLPVELPAGQYELVVGLYDISTGARLFMPNSPFDEFTLTTLEITQR
jgi:hypothetical protein